MEKQDKRTIRNSGCYKTRAELTTAVHNLIKFGATNNDIAALVDVSSATVSRIRHGDHSVHSSKDTENLTNPLTLLFNSLWKIRPQEHK